jgi:hypothetical protein
MRVSSFRSIQGGPTAAVGPPTLGDVAVAGWSASEMGRGEATRGDTGFLDDLAAGVEELLVFVGVLDSSGRGGRVQAGGHDQSTDGRQRAGDEVHRPFYTGDVEPGELGGLRMAQRGRKPVVPEIPCLLGWTEPGGALFGPLDVQTTELRGTAHPQDQ